MFIRIYTFIAFCIFRNLGNLSRFILRIISFYKNPWINTTRTRLNCSEKQVYINPNLVTNIDRTRNSWWSKTTINHGTARDAQNSLTHMHLFQPQRSRSKNIKRNICNFLNRRNRYRCAILSPITALIRVRDIYRNHDLQKSHLTDPTNLIES